MTSDPPPAGPEGRRGTVYLVGAGPGDIGLMTVRACRLTASCDVLVYDALAPAAAARIAPPEAERIYVGKRGSDHTLEQPDINALLAARARKRKIVVRLKGGDPFVFGRGGEEAEHLAKEGIPFEVVPGVTAGVAAPAYAGIPVTHRGLSSAVALVTGHEDPSKPESSLDYAALARVGTVCFYMGVGKLAEICAGLLKHLPPGTPAATISEGTLPTQRVVAATLRDLPRKVREAGLKAPAITVVGKVAAMGGRLGWFARRPLHGRTVIVTRPADPGSRLPVELESLGARVLDFPTIRIERAEDPAPLARAARQLGSYDWVVLTSARGVEALFGALAEAGLDARGFGRARVAAIGPGTAEALAAGGIAADLVPAKHVSEELLRALRGKGGVEGGRFLLPRADIAREGLADGLRRLGADVTEVVAYRTVPEDGGGGDALAALDAGAADWVTFTSASTVTHFARRIGRDRLKRIRASGLPRAASIGPVTSAALRELGLRVDVEAEDHSFPGLAKAILGARARRKSAGRKRKAKGRT